MTIRENMPLRWISVTVPEKTFTALDSNASREMIISSGRIPTQTSPSTAVTVRRVIAPRSIVASPPLTLDTP